MTVFGFTLPSGLATAETVSHELNSTVSSQSSETLGSTSSSETYSETGSLSSETASPAESVVENSSASEKNTKSSTTVPIQMLGINDFHGALSTTGSYYGANGSKVSGAGTASLLAAYFSQAESNFKQTNNKGKTLRVQAGDMVGASPANSGLLQDQPTMRILNQMNFDVGTLGNHEFDEGLGEFNRILTGTKPDPDSEFYDIVKNYNNDYTQDQLKGGFDLVIANVREKNTGAIPYGWEPYTIKNVGTTADPINIGFIGVITTEVPNLVLAQHHQEYTFTDPADEIAKYSQELVGKGVNAIVVLGHTPSVQGEGESVSGEAADIMKKVNQVNPDNSVDAFFAGHNHVYTNGVVESTRIVQATSQGKGYIDLQGDFDTDTKDFAETPKATVNPVDPNGSVTPDSTIEAVVSDADNRVKEVTEEKIGTADKAESITRTVNELGESPVGNLITDAQVYMAKKNGEDVDFAMTNNGGIRDDLKVKEDSSITWGAAQAVQPFGNIMQIVEMTGQQIKNVLNQQTFKYDPNDARGSGYFLQVAGLRYTVRENPDKNDTEHQYIVEKLLKSDGTEIEADRTYKLVINDFLYGGGDGFSEFTQAKLTGALDPDTETFIGYIKDLEASGKKVSAAIEGRKTIVDPVTEETEKIKAETVFDKYREGDKSLTGKTIPNGLVTVTSVKTRALAQVRADKDGNINLAVNQLGLTEGQEITVSIEGENGGRAEFPITVLAMETTQTTSSSNDPAIVETKQIKEKTEINDIHEKDQYLTGKTIPNATIEIFVAEDNAVAKAEGKVAVQAETPQVSNAEGKFEINIQNLNLKEGQNVIISITGPNGGQANFHKTVLAEVGVDPAADAESAKIKKETTLNDFYEGDARLTGKTIVNAAVNVSIDESGKFVQGESDEKGNITIDVKELNLKKDQKFTVTVYGSKGGQVSFSMTVLKREITSNVTGGGNTSQNWLDSAWKKVYPNTGEGEQPIFVVLGMVALAASGWMYFKKR